MSADASRFDSSAAHVSEVAVKIRALTNMLGGHSGELVFQEVMGAIKKHVAEQRREAYSNGYDDGFAAGVDNERGA